MGWHLWQILFRSKYIQILRQHTTRREKHQDIFTTRKFNKKHIQFLKKQFIHLLLANNFTTAFCRVGDVGYFIIWMFLHTRGASLTLVDATVLILVKIFLFLFFFESNWLLCYQIRQNLLKIFKNVVKNTYEPLGKETITEGASDCTQKATIRW